MFLYAIICNYISFFGTNLLTQCPVPVAVFLLVFVFSENHYQKESKREKKIGLIFSEPEETHEASGEDQKSHEEATSLEGAPPGLWAPRCPSWPNSSTINSQIFPIYQRERRENLSAAASLYSSAIPSGGLFQYSTGGGIDHGGLLHQPCCPSDDVWVVYHRLTGP